MKKLFSIILVFISSFGFCQIEETQAYKDFETLSFQYLNQLEEGKVDAALENALKAKELVEQNFKSHAYYAFTLNNIGYIYFRLEDYNSSLPYFLEAKEIKKLALGTNHAEYAAIVNQIGLVNVRLGNYKDALISAIEYSDFIKNNFGEHHLKYSESLQSIGFIYEKLSQHEEALIHFVKSSEIIKENLGDKHIDYAEVLNVIGLNLGYLSKENEALKNYEEAKSIWELNLGKDHIKVATALNNIATSYIRIGDYNNAKENLIKAMAIQKATNGNKDPSYATAMHNLATVFSNLGNFDEAIKYGTEALTIREGNFGKNHSSYALTTNNLGYDYAAKGLYEIALEHYFEALNIWKTLYGEYHPDYAVTLNNIGNVYIDLGDYEKSIEFLTQSSTIRKQIYGENHPAYGVSLNNLGSVFSKKGDYKSAIEYTNQAKEIIKLNFGEQHPNYGQTLNNLGVYYSKLGSNNQAIDVLLEAKKVRTLVYGNKHPSYALTLNNLGLSYFEMENYDLAEQCFKEAKEISFINFGENHKDYLLYLNNLSDLYFRKNQISEATKLKLEGNEIYIRQLENVFKFRSEKEKKQYLESTMSLYDDMLQSIAFYTNYKDEQLLNTLVNNSLVYKGLLLNSSKNIIPKLEELNIQEINTLISKYNSKRIFVAKQLQVSASERVEGFNKHKDTLNQLEVELTKMYSDRFGDDLKLTKNWKEINLKNNEAAIEFTHFRYNNGKWTDSTLYVAYLYKKDWEKPVAIPLFEHQQLNRHIKSATSPNKLYASRGSISKSTKVTAGSEDLYNLIWEPLEKYLEHVENVYFSPDGLLHKIPFAALSKNGKLLSESYNLVQLGTTSTINELNSNPSFTNATFFGGIEYEYTQVDKQIKKQKYYNSLKDLEQSKGTRSLGETWSYLSGTLEEITAIKTMFDEQKKPTKLYSRKKASEDEFKKFSGNSPKLLHLATHGFFFEPEPIDYADTSGLTDAQATKEPLLRSGLILAGANYAWQHGNNPYEEEDGILTALEISNLDLSNTDVVVLSACETGLGDIDGSEGVYGLQRAFKMAGVNVIVMSLWEVPDNETSEFMQLFYSNWLGGMKVREAFRNTQRNMSAKYKDTPEKWAAFVLVE